MTRSWPVRASLLLTLSLLVALGGVLGSAPSAQAVGTSPSQGEYGSGPPAWQLPPPVQTAAASSIKWNDVPGSFWARQAIDFVGGTNDWMRDYRPADDGTYPFKPNKPERRKLFARAVVKAFASEAEPDPGLRFPDLARDDPFFPYANVAVSKGWMGVGRDGSFEPGEPVTMADVHRALVKALGLTDVAKGLGRIHTAGGYRFRHSKSFATTLLGMRVGLRYNHGVESLDVGPASRLPRAEVAHSLWRAATMPSGVIDAMAPYATIELPSLRRGQIAVVEWGIRHVGFPYVWGGEWYEPTGAGYCCGSQPVGGFDCSGLTWWVMRRGVPGWDPAPPRPYRGWSLPQRTSADMASVGRRLRYRDLRPGDLMFYDGSGDGQVDHVDMYVGNGWAVDSSSGVGGVTILRVGEGWYRDHFKWGRRIT